MSSSLHSTRTRLELTGLARLPGQGTSEFFVFPSAEILGMHCYIQRLMQVLQSSCVSSKHFTDWAIFPASELILLTHHPGPLETEVAEVGTFEECVFHLGRKSPGS